MLTKDKKEELLEIFKSMDQARQVFGPDEKGALHFHGIMLGMRETLEEKGVEVAGITGLWLYEKIDGKRQKSIDELIEENEDGDELIPVLKGSVKGRNIILKILNA